MRLGCCINMFATPEDPIGQRYLPALAASGFNYVELPLAQVSELSPESFDQLLQSLRINNIPCECCNNFFPATLRLTGQSVDWNDIDCYLHVAVERAVRLGAKVIVLGSAGAKNIPDGFPHEQAIEQLAQLLRRLEKLLANSGITIVLEPLNRRESNCILNLTESSALMKRADKPYVQLLVDYYHFILEQDSLSLLHQCAPHLRHVHLALPEGRKIPVEPDEAMRQFIQTLEDSGYNARISLEAFSPDPLPELSLFVQMMHRIVSNFPAEFNPMQ